MNFWQLVASARAAINDNDKVLLNSILIDMSDIIQQSEEVKRHQLSEFFNKFIETFDLNFNPEKIFMQSRLHDFKKSTVDYAKGRSIDECVLQVESGVSLVTCCMNRNENLLKALVTWINCPEISEIIIVDWSSTDPVYNYIRANGIWDDRIKVIRVNDQPRWILSYAFNIGFRMSSYDKILKTDADIILNTDFFEKNKLDGNVFIAGDWKAAKKGQEHINGFFYLTRENLMRVKGFNEYITTYGWDDDDIYDRLGRSGLKRTLVDLDTIYHIPHDDAKRIDSNPDVIQDNLYLLEQTPKFKIRANRYTVGVMPIWDTNRVYLPFEIAEASGGLITLRKSGDSIHYVPPWIRNDAEYYAALELTSWKIGLRAYDLDREQLRQVLRFKHFDGLTALDIEVAIQNQDKDFQYSTNYLVLKISPSLARSHAREIQSIVNLLLHQCKIKNIGLILSSDSPDHVKPFMNAGENIGFVVSWRNIGQIKISDFDHFAQDIKEHDNHLLLELNEDAIVNFMNLIEAEAKISQNVTIQIPQAKVYIDAQHGLGNRLRAVASAAAIAEASDRELVIVWEPDHHCECRFSDLFNYKGAVIERAFPRDALTQGLSMYNYMEIEEGANKGLPIDLSSNLDIYARSAYVLNSEFSHWEAENKFLKDLKLTNEILDMLAPFELTNHIGAHVRMEAGKGLDHNTYDSVENWTQDGHDQLHFWRENSHFSLFLNRIDEIISEQPETKLFLATDLPENYETFLNYYGDKLSYLPREVYDRSALQIKFALADAVLLSRCSKLLGSTWSSFSELAMRLSSTFSSIEMSGKDF